MRLYEFIDSDQQLIDLVTPILLRAKSEGATEVNVSQLMNDINDPAISSEMLVGVLNRKRNFLKNLVTSATLDKIVLNVGPAKSMTSSYDKQIAKMKTTAVNQAKDALK